MRPQSPLSAGKRLFPALLVTIWLLAGCTAPALRDARTAFYADRPEAAAQRLSKLERPSKKDRLLYYMEKGLILHHMGDYEGSIREFLAASAVMDRQEVISVSRQSASMVTGEWASEYKGEYCERLWVHTHLMMNFLLLYKYENALVEAKQALKLLDKYPEPLAGDHFTRALIALCYENMGQLNDAFIEYEKLAESLDDPASIAPTLYRLAAAPGFEDKAARYLEFIPRNRPLPPDPPEAELVIFAALGRGPLKIPGNIILPPSIRFSFPEYRSRPYSSRDVRVLSDAGRLVPFFTAATDLDTVAAASLQARGAAMFAKETARAGLKEALAQAVERKNNDLIGLLVRGALFIMEEPDTRCWQTLPGKFTLLRIPLSRGTHHIRASVFGRGGRIIREIPIPEFTVSPGQRRYYALRVVE